MNYFAHPTAVLDLPCSIGDGTKIWHFCHISEGATIGERCNLGQNVYVAGNVRIGNNCKIQNNVSLYDGVTLEDDVFCGPSMVFTNIRNPRSAIVRRGEFVPTHVGRGATIGANATIVCGVRIGEYAFIGAGAVLTHDVPAYALMAGVPARRIGWAGRSGIQLERENVASHIFICPETGEHYEQIGENTLRMIQDHA